MNTLYVDWNIDAFLVEETRHGIPHENDSQMVRIQNPGRHTPRWILYEVGGKLQAPLGAAVSNMAELS